MSTAPAEVASTITNLFLRGRGREQLTAEDLAVLDASCSGVRSVPARQVMVRTGEVVRECTLLLEGTVCRYMDDRAGHRQLVSLHVPGDFIDLHGYPLRRLDHDLATIGPARVATWSHASLKEAIHGRDRLTRVLWMSTLLEAAMHREWIFRLGRLNAEGRVAHLMCEMDVRLEMVGLSTNHSFTLPLTQSDLAEACGLTGVHVNRVLRALRESDVMTFRGGRVTIMDRARLKTLGEFDPTYLYASEDFGGQFG